MITEDDKKEIVTKYKLGETLQSIANYYDVSRQYIDQLLNRAGAPRRGRRKVTDGSKADVLKLAQEGVEYDDISLRTGLSKSTVCVILKKSGYKREKKEYVCSKCGGTDWRANGKTGKVCRPCSAKRARDNYKKRNGK